MSIGDLMFGWGFSGLALPRQGRRPTTGARHDDPRFRATFGRLACRSIMKAGSCLRSALESLSIRPGGPRAGAPHFKKPPTARFSILTGLLLTLALATRTLAASEPQAIDRLMTTLHELGEFNGAVLVATRGTVIYRQSFGKADVHENTDLTPETPFDIASVTKQFTAMAVMMLAEQDKIQFDDPVSKFIPEFSRSSPAREMTIRHLLTHTSGIPDFDDLSLDDSGLSETALIKGVLERQAMLQKPGQRFRYSNPGYKLLAIIVMRVSGQPLDEFLERRIFRPLGMGDTYVFNARSKRRPNTAAGYNQFGDKDDVNPSTNPGGDGGVFSTVDDLFKWDQALYTDRLVRQSTLSQAFTPAKVDTGGTSYGFGWNIAKKQGVTLVWHTGKTAGFRAFIGRRLGDRATVILLTNQGDSKRMEISECILNILDGKPFTLPKASGSRKLYNVIRDSGIQAALQLFNSLKGARSAEFDFGESELNTLGYKLLYGDKRAGAAIAIFQLNTEEHPRSSNAFDSLGEACRVGGQKRRAIECYQKAISLDPANLHAAAMLKELK